MGAILVTILLTISVTILVQRLLTMFRFFVILDLGDTNFIYDKSFYFNSQQKLKCFQYEAKIWLIKVIFS